MKLSELSLVVILLLMLVVPFAVSLQSIVNKTSSPAVTVIFDSFNKILSVLFGGAHQVFSEIKSNYN